MKISFITASYNYEEYIGETIKSVLAQTISDWEMIVVDDGSKDKSVNLIKKFCKKDSRVRLFRHQGGKNCGLAKTLQLGLEKSSGDWIVFLESDDTIEPNYLEEKIKIINNYPTVKFIFNDVNPVGNQKGFDALNKNTACNYFEKMHERVNRMTFPQRPFKEFKDFNFIPTFSCVMLKKEILDDISFISPIPQWLDTYLWSQLVGKYEFFYVDKKLTNWRLHDNSYNNKSLSDEQKHEFMNVVYQNIEDSVLSKWEKLYLKFRKKRKNLIRIHLKKGEVILCNKKFNFKGSNTYIMNKDLISIVLPVYNAEENIEKCLRSVLSQTYTNLEVVIVYLKGTDRTLEIINSFNDPRIKIVNQLTKTGPGGARNIGLDNVSGKYVGFIEADDYIPSNFYEQLHRDLVTKDADLSICEIVEPRENNTESYITRISENKVCKTLQTRLETMTNGAAFNKLIKNSIIQKHKIRFTEHYRFEDNPWLLKVLYYAQRITLIKGVKYYYCCQGEQWTEKYIAFLKESIPPIAKEMVEFAKKKHFSDQEQDQVGKIVMNSFVRNFIQDETVYNALKKILGSDFFYKHADEFRKEFGFPYMAKKSKWSKFKEKMFSKKKSGMYKIWHILGIRLKYKSLKVAYKTLERQLQTEQVLRTDLENKVNALIRNEEAARFNTDGELRSKIDYLNSQLSDIVPAVTSSLESEFEKIMNITDDLKEGISSEEKRIDSLDEDCISIRKNIKNIAETLDGKIKNISESLSDIEKQCFFLTKLIKTDRESFDKKVDKNIENLALLKQKLNDVIVEADNGKKAFEKQIKNNEKNLETLDKELSKSLTNLQNLSGSVDDLRSDSKKLDSKIEENALSVKNLNTLLSDTKNDFNDFKENNVSELEKVFDQKYPQISPYELIGNKVKEKMGRHSYACQYFTVASEDTTIGSFCSIADNVSIGTTHHPTEFLSSHPFCYFEPVKITEKSKQVKFEYRSPCHIGNDVWIGKSVIIMDGVTVGDGAIIGSNAVVTKDVPPYAIVAGVPAKIIRFRFDQETVKELLKIKWWNLPEEDLANLPYNDVKKCIALLKKKGA